VTAEPRSEVPEEPVDRELFALARANGLPYARMREFSPKELSALRMRHAKKLRKEAKARGIDPDAFTKATEADRERLRAEHPEKPDIEHIAKKHAARQLAPAAPEPREAAEAEGGEEDDWVETAVPDTEIDARRREHVSIGAAKALFEEDDVRLRANPIRFLGDLFAHFPVGIGEGENHLRVERTLPKVWESVPCSGEIAKITHPITEAEFQSYFGGREYEVTVWGPDPRGRRDENTELPKIVRKTDAIKVTVPIYPPNLRVLPDPRPPASKQDPPMQDPSNPFASFLQGPLTPAAAQVHKGNLEFVTTLLDRTDKENARLRERAETGNAAGTKDILQVVTGSQDRVLEAERKSAERREQSLLEQINREKDEKKALAERMQTIETELRTVQTARATSPNDFVEFAKHLSPPGQTAELTTRMRDAHEAEIRQVRASCDDTVKALKERQVDEMSREQARYRDLENFYKTKLVEREDEIRRRVSELREELDETRKREREVTDARVKETERRYDDRIKDIKEQQERELRMLSEQYTTRAESQKTTLEFRIENERERAKRFEHEAQEAREEAEDAKDPIKAKEKADELAEAYGYVKPDDNGPKTTGERFVAGISAGASKALEDIGTWLPAVVDKFTAGRTAQGGMPQLPPGARPQGPPQQQRPPAASSRGVAWATKVGAPPPMSPVGIPATPMGMQEPPPAPGAPAPAAAAAPPPAAPAPSNGAPPAGGGLLAPEIVVTLRAEIERALEAGFPAEAFAERLEQLYPEPVAGLVSQYRLDHLIEAIVSMPDGASSPILRRDGRKWLESCWVAIIGRVRARLAAPAAGAPG